MEKYNFVGKKITPEIKQEISQKLDESKQKGMAEILDDEIIKTPEELKMIKDVETALNEELKELDLPANFHLDPREIHITEKTKIKDGFASRGGAHHPLSQQTELIRYKDPVTRTKDMIKQVVSRIFKTKLDLRQAEFMKLVHESAHLESHHKYELTYSDKKQKHNINPFYRTGYQLFSNKRSDILFQGLNEGVVQQTTLDVINKWNAKLEKGEKEKNTYPVYTAQMKVVDSIINKIAETNKETKEDVWKRFKKGQFTGQMMHLRDVEKTFGEGSLYILALMKGRESKITKNLFIKYFSTDNSLERKVIGAAILGEEKVKDYIRDVLG